MQYEIIPFQNQYTAQVKDLIGNLLVYTGTLNQSDLPIDDEDLDNIPGIYTGRGGFWLAISNGIVIGSVGLKDVGDSTVKLKRMFVKADLHGTGIGEALLKHAIEHARERGFSRIILNTNEHMTRAHHFYEKHGFKNTGKTDTQLHYVLELGCY